jgi:hypothetical protein
MYFEYIGTVFKKFSKNDNNGKKKDIRGILGRGDSILVGYQQIRKNDPLGAGIPKNQGNP